MTCTAQYDCLTSWANRVLLMRKLFQVNVVFFPQHLGAVLMIGGKHLLTLASWLSQSDQLHPTIAMASTITSL